jgi:hypothetical protein
MPRILLGFVLGTALLVGGSLVWFRATDGCLGRCGDGTRCEAHRCIAAAASRIVTSAPATQKHRRRRAHGGDGLPAAAPEAQLQPGDEKMVAQGDALGRPEHIDLTETGDGPRELSQDDLDQAFRPSEAAITRCITDALGDAPLETAHVEVGMRIERDGKVGRVRVEGPALLQRNGLTRCVRSVVTSIRFPAAGGASVVTYPFEVK